MSVGARGEKVSVHNLDAFSAGVRFKRGSHIQACLCCAENTTEQLPRLHDQHQ